MKKWLNVMYIVVFIVSLFLPLFFSDYEGGKILVAENRYTTKFPIVDSTEEMSFGQFKEGIEAWINDNVGGRSLASSLNANIQFSLLGSSVNQTVLIGKDQFLFYYEDHILADYMGTNLPQEETLEEVMDSLEIIDNYLDQKGIFLQLVLLPDKKTIYPEKYPDGIIRYQNICRSDAIGQYIRDNSKLHYLDLRDALMNAKQYGYVYSPRIDTAHWNALGAYVGYQNICESLSRYFSTIHTPGLRSDMIHPYESKGMFFDAVPLTETNYTIQTGYENTYRDDSGMLDAFDSILTYNSIPSLYKKRTVNNDQSTPKVLLFGDSYTELLLPYLSQSFSDVTLLHYVDLDKLPYIIDTLKPDIVIIESVERMIELAKNMISSCADNINSLN